MKIDINFTHLIMCNSEKRHCVGFNRPLMSLINSNVFPSHTSA